MSIEKRNAIFKLEALGFTRSFFVFLKKTYGIEFSDAELYEVTKSGCRDAANHINRHRIYQRTFDGLKLTSFLIYRAALCIRQTRSHGAPHIDPVREVCRAGIERLARILELETSKEIILEDRDKGYLASMLYDEVISRERCTSGIGPNGLSSTFTFLQRIRPDPDRLAKI